MTELNDGSPCSDELARRRQELPWVRIDRAYQLETDDENAALATGIETGSITQPAHATTG